MNDPNFNRQLGPYRLQHVVGRGGMGTVYAARDEQLGKIAAVKLLSPVLATDESFRERFIAEIESLKKLRHPNIVQLYGYGEQDGQLFYAMELIVGNSLQGELQHGRRFTWREVTQIAVEVCAALKHAHDHGIIHRDLKPANLLYARDESVKLLDFGIAKLFGNTGITTGSVMGTADYMAPEQAEGKPVGPRTDLYSLGCVMYALLAGRPPFSGKSVPEVVHKVRFESPIPIGRLASDVPVELEHLIDQLLEKNPQKRIPTALAASHRLRAMEHALSVRPPPSPTPDDIDTSVSRPPASDLTHADKTTGQPTVRLDDHAQHAEDQLNRVTVTTRESEAESGPNHFTLVDDERATREPTSRRWQAAASFVLLLAAGWIGYLAFREFTRPSTADELYAKLLEAAKTEDARAQQDVRTQSETFLASFPADPRSLEVKRLQHEADLGLLQRRLEAKARQRNPQSDAPLEAWLVEILRELRRDPDQAAQRLQALVDLNAGKEPREETESNLLELAQRQLARLREAQAAEAKVHGPLMEQRVAEARALADQNPELAGKICRALIMLYGSKPWAEIWVAQAREMLAELPAEHPLQTTRGDDAGSS